MIDNFWEEVAAALAVASVIGGAVVWAIRASIRGMFVPAQQHHALAERVGVVSERVSAVEQKLLAAPGHNDFQSLSIRLNAVEMQQGVMQATLKGVSDGVSRVEHILDMLVQHTIRKEAE